MVEQSHTMINGEALSVKIAVGGTAALPGETEPVLSARLDELLRQSELSDNYAVKMDAEVM